MTTHPDVPFWLCVGDVADADGRYAAFPKPLYWTKGNNENFDLIAAAASANREGPPYEVLENLFFIPNGERLDVGRMFTRRSLVVAGLGGTFAPTMYELRSADLPHPKKGTAKATELADRRRHFVHEEVEACKRMTDVDVLLTHEAPRPFRVGRIDAGKTPVNEVLAAMKPRLHFFGHHHRFEESERNGVPSVCLDLVARSYVLVDSETLDITVASE